MKQPLLSTSYAPRDGESTLDEIESIRHIHSLPDVNMYQPSSEPEGN